MANTETATKNTPEIRAAFAAAVAAANAEVDALGTAELEAARAAFDAAEANLEATIERTPGLDPEPIAAALEAAAGQYVPSPETAGPEAAAIAETIHACAAALEIAAGQIHAAMGALTLARAEARRAPSATRTEADGLAIADALADAGTAAEAFQGAINRAQAQG